MALPEEFFKTKFNKCFCLSCHNLRSASTYKVKGHPPREYAVPLGWYRYGLRVKARAKSLKIFDSWNVAYSGVKLASVRRILDCGDLLSVADLSPGTRNAIFALNDGEEKKPDTFESVPVILSPSIRYAACHHFTDITEYRDPKTHKLYKVKVAFEACIKPGSFNAGPQTLEVGDIVDAKLNGGEIEWATKDKGSVEVYGLLVKIDEC